MKVFANAFEILYCCGKVVFLSAEYFCISITSIFIFRSCICNRFLRENQRGAAFASPVCPFINTTSIRVRATTRIQREI